MIINILKKYYNNLIYKNISYKQFINNIINISNKLKLYKNIIIYLPNCYQYIELIFASFLSNTNLIHSSKDSILNILNSSTIDTIITCHSYYNDMDVLGRRI